MDLVAFLAARLDADEAMAKAATGEGSPWAWEHTGYGTSSWALGHVQTEDGTDLHGNIIPGSGVVIDTVCESTTGRPADGAHIARHDPARVLREVEAKRRILADYEMWRAHADTDPAGTTPAKMAAGALLPVVRHLAAVYSGHPDYDEAWGLS